MENLIKNLLFEWKERPLPLILDRDVDLEQYLYSKINKIIAISGFRRVGKTYSILNLINNLLKNYSKEEVVYINFEDERIPNNIEFLTKLIPTIRETFGEKIKFLFLDEIQNISNWSKWLRRIYDTENFKIFISGSSSKMTSYEIPTELRGRFLEVKMFPLSFKEFLRFKEFNFDLEKINFSTKRKSLLLNLLNEFIHFGGLPEIVLENKIKKLEIVNSYYQTVVRKDIIETYKIKNEEALKTLLRLLLNSKQYSISKTYNNLKSLNFKVSKSTIQRYIQYINESKFMFSVEFFSYSAKDQMQYPKKNYFIDNVFIDQLSNKEKVNLGRLYENLVAIELKRRNLDIFYWSNSQKQEVNFVIKSYDKIKSLIQVCYDIKDYTTKKREIRALINASKNLKCKNLLIITKDYEAEEILEWYGTKRKIKFLPLWKWLLFE